jgi:hypothetical protein
LTSPYGKVNEFKQPHGVPVGAGWAGKQGAEAGAQGQIGGGRVASVDQLPGLEVGAAMRLCVVSLYPGSTKLPPAV